MKQIIIVLYTFSLTACVTMPGGVKTSQSTYDGSTEVIMEPGWASWTEKSQGIFASENQNWIMLGAQKSSRMEKDEAVIVVRNQMATPRHFSATHPNLFIKIDNIETKLSPINIISECEVVTSSMFRCEQSYSVKTSLLKKISTAKEVKLKINLRDSYVEGQVPPVGTKGIRSGLITFLQAVQKMGEPVTTGPENRTPSSKTNKP